MYVDASLMPAHSRIWIYQSNRELNDKEVFEITARAKQFLETWTAHENALIASVEIPYGHFIVIMIDEMQAGAGGCSIDKSVHFIQSLERDYNLSLLDRMQFAYKKEGRVEVVSKSEFEKLVSNGGLNDNTIVFNNLVQTKAELKSHWEIPFKESWHRQLV